MTQQAQGGQTLIEPLNIELPFKKDQDPETHEGRAMVPGSVCINGLMCHATAYRVHDVGEDGFQVAYLGFFQEDVERIQASCEGRAATVHLFDDHDEWVIEITPFQD